MQIWTTLHYQLFIWSFKLCGHDQYPKWWCYTKWCIKGRWLAWLKQDEAVFVDFLGLTKLHWLVSSNEPKFGEAPYFLMSFNPVKCHVKWRSFIWPNTDQTPSGFLLKPPSWSILLFSMASTFYHMIIELLATPSNFPSTPAPWLRGKNPSLPCWTANFH